MKLQRVISASLIVLTLSSCYYGPAYRPVYGRPVVRPVPAPVIIPVGARPYYHGGVRYYTHRGVWYRPHGGGHIICPRPF
ncbi:hypothetical protein [Prosthecobacter vanneervenii]|uniref:Lipoprotein n=1 Tax=Prosthecobacter vanneervenii TaxID=48466 RepID=A0A7W7Y6W1_9BACT|nr:hypothetical protein [Prosthecobacter vanneervenii]MBB5030714.1 hypothetical protein [Prosthecobacter vanneervenii]